MGAHRHCWIGVTLLGWSQAGARRLSPSITVTSPAPALPPQQRAAAGSCLMLITNRTIALHQRPAPRQQQQQAARGMLRVPPSSYLPNPCRGGAGGTAASLPSVAAQAVGKSGCMRAVHCFLVFLPPNIDNMGLSEDLAVNRA